MSIFCDPAVLVFIIYLGWGCCMCVLSYVRLFATPWTVAPVFLCLWNFPGKNTIVGCYFLL